MRWLVLALFLLLPHVAAAQMTPNLVADHLAIDARGRLIASGHVEAFYDGTRLTASAISYDPASDRLTITGPILITGADGEILTADSASLDPRFENGLLRGARLVLDRQLQLAANRIDRSGGTLTQLSRVAATSCNVCAGQQPLWEIRAETVVHDAAAQQLYFDNAVLRIRGVPVLWLPAMRLPDPTLDRSTGLLIPQLRSSNQLGVGLALPWFLRLGDSRDLTLTPYISPETRTIEARYRQAFRQGGLTIDAALSRDSLIAGELRGRAQAVGSFDLGRDLRLDFDVSTTSDPAYLLDYGLSDLDRTQSHVTLTRVRPDSLFTAELLSWQSTREGETFESLPPVIARTAWERRRPLGFGIATLGAGAEAFVRTAAGTGDAARDVAHLGAMAGWQGARVIGPGIVAELRGVVDLDAWAIGDDPAWPETVLRATPAAQVVLRWPLSRQGAGGAVQVLEPVVALGWSQGFGDLPPNEDSTLSELDEANLTDLSRFAGNDRREDGLTFAAGMTWTRIAASGDTLTLTFGRLVRQEAAADFTASSGLAGVRSDWLIAGSLDLASGLGLSARTLLDADLSFGKTEARLHWSTDRLVLHAAYVFLPADSDEGRDDDVSEWTLATDWTINDTWAIRASGRYDLANNTPARAGFGVAWSNECVTVDLSVSRRYTETETAEAATSLGLTVTLNGFSAGRAAGPVAQCRN